jgi:hypothetical protein
MVREEIRHRTISIVIALMTHGNQIVSRVSASKRSRDDMLRRDIGGALMCTISLDHGSLASWTRLSDAGIDSCAVRRGDRLSNFAPISLLDERNASVTPTVNLAL